MRKFFKHIHIWLSMPFGLVMSLTCFTGAVLIFEKEITESVQSEYYFVDSVTEDILPMTEVVSLAEAHLTEGQSITGVVISADPERCYKVNLSSPKHAAIYVDQYSGEVKGQPERLPFFAVMFRLHRWLMDTRPEDGGIYWGKVIVGVSTLAMVVVLITGIFIWVPKSVKMWRNRSTIALRKGWRRFWYDLHVAGGIYAVLLILAMSLTGLTWSFKWYNKGFSALFGVDVTAPAAAKSGGGRGAQSVDISPYAHWDAALDYVSGEYDYPVDVTLSHGKASVKLAGWGNPRATDNYLFDNGSGEMLSVESYSDTDRRSKLRGWIYAIHVGNWGGILTRVMWFLAALIGATLPLTGYYLWIKRKFLCKRKCEYRDCPHKEM